MTFGESRLASFFSPPDADLVQAGAGGERLIARIRLIFSAALSVVPLVVISIADEVRPEFRIAVVVGLVHLVIAALILRFVQRRSRIPGLAVAMTIFDVTIVSAALVAFALAGRPIVAVNSMVFWPLYLLFIFVTSLRFDHRITLLAGALSFGQSLAVVFWVDRVWNLSSPDSLYGQLSWTVQIARLFLIVVATVLTIGMVRRSRRLVVIAGTDALTGLWNRAYFDHRLSTEIARARRTGAPLGIAFVDLDRFKRVNDRWGHETGDAILLALTRVLQSESRRGDVVARWGGEEFVLILTDADVGGSLQQLERIRAELATTPMPVPEDDYRVTVSAGLAAFPGDGETADELMATADRRLLVAKQSGRDRVVTSDEETG